MGDSNYLYWDTCIFLDGLRKTPGRFEHIERIERQAKAGEYFIYVSALVIAEVVKISRYAPMTDDEARLIADYFRHKFIRVIPLDRPIARAAAAIARQFNVKPPDAVHIATAIRARCSVLVTYDGDSTPVSGLLALNGQIPSLEIRRPNDLISGLFSP